MRDLDRMSKGKMYYSEPMSGNNGMSTGTHDEREGSAGMSRRSYIETKELHRGDSTADKDAKMKELEKYMKSLAEDVIETLSSSVRANASHIDFDNALESFFGTIKPELPTISLTPPQSVATTIPPQDIASHITKGIPSHEEDITYKSIADIHS